MHIQETSRRLARRFGAMMRSEDGSVAIEAAIIFPVGFLLMITTLEMVLWVFANSGLDSVARDMAYLASQECAADDKVMADATGRAVKCGKIMTASEREDRLRGKLSTFVGGLIDPKDLCIQVQAIAPAGPANNLGGSNQIMRYQFHYQWKFFTLMVDKFFHDANQFNSTYLIRNGEIQSPGNRQFSWPGTC